MAIGVKLQPAAAAAAITALGTFASIMTVGSILYKQGLCRKGQQSTSSKQVSSQYPVKAHRYPASLLSQTDIMASHRTGSGLFLLAVIAMAAVAQPAAAFCVYNTGSKSSATFLAWPLSGHTFK